MTYLHYSPAIEQPKSDEQEVIDGIIHGMMQQAETVEKKEAHAVRASHAKSTACAIGEFVIAGDSSERVRYFDEVMTFRPAGSSAAQRPLGSAMRARLPVYKALSNFRHRHNGVTSANTRSIEEIPA